MDYTALCDTLVDFTHVLSSRLARLGDVVSTQTFLQLQRQPGSSIAPATGHLSFVLGTIFSNHEPAVQLIFDMATVASFREFVHGKINGNHQANVSIEEILAHLTETRDRLKMDTIDTNWLKQIVMFYSGMFDIQICVSPDQQSVVASKLNSFQNQSHGKEKEVLALGSKWYQPAFCLLPAQLHPLLVDIGIYLVHRGVHLRQLYPSDGESDESAQLEQTISELFQVLLTAAPRDKLECMFERLECEMRMLHALPNPPHWVYVRVDVLKRMMMAQLGPKPSLEPGQAQLEPIGILNAFEEDKESSQPPELDQYETELFSGIMRLLDDCDEEVKENMQPLGPGGQVHLDLYIESVDIQGLFDSHKENVTPYWNRQ